MLGINRNAPDFNLDTVFGEGEDFKTASLKDYSGKWLVLFFYPRGFTFVWPTELKALDEAYDRIEKAGASVLAVSTDSTFVHKTWMEKNIGFLKYPLGADTSHTMSRYYEVLEEASGAVLRGTYIIDPQGVIRYSSMQDTGVGRNVRELIRILLALKNGGLMPANWEEGQPTL